ncbi:MAG: PhnD/SsuA/transferrin family substrate-binding protein [Caulobacter sp.]
MTVALFDPALGSSLLIAPSIYDLPELEGAHEAFWTAVQVELEKLPSAQDASDAPAPIGQICSYQYAAHWADKLRLLATPRYGAPGCHGPFVRHVVVVARSSPAQTLADLRDARCAVGATMTNAVSALRAAVAPLSGGQSFFSDLIAFPNETSAALAVAEGEADLASLDCVAFALLLRARPQLVQALRVLSWSGRAPAAPFVAEANTTPDQVVGLQAALHAVARDPSYKSLRAELLLDGVNGLPSAHYRAALHLESLAAQRGYSRLI